MHRATTSVLSLALIALGVAMVVTALAGGGGPLATGVVLGLLFAAAGGARLWLTRAG